MVTLVLAVSTAASSALLNLLVGRVVGALPGVLSDAPGALPMDSFAGLFIAFSIVFVIGVVLPD